MDDVSQENLGGIRTEYRLPPIATRVDVVKDQDGNVWVSHTVQLGALSFTYGIPLDQANTYAQNFADHVRSLVKEAKRKQLGIVLPDDGVTKRTVSGLVVPDGANGKR